MLDFFRRYQRYFFIVITIVIIISFSFFGTYSTLSDGSFREQIAFKTVNGTDITRHELDEMVNFIGTDSTDKLIFGGVWGPNFLNDGVISKDFLQTGLGVVLGMEYSNDVASDLKARLSKEKRYSLYVHPQARFIGVESAWNYFAPSMVSYYYQMRSANDPLDQNALRARAALYVMERQFPPQILRQVLRYQEKQNSFVSPDRNLEYADLSLFGYHTLEDWFGPRFVRLAAQFIINAAEIAEKKGYQVSKADAIADLMRNSELSFQQNSRNPNVGVASSQEYYNEQLRRLGMDQNGAANVWRQVMLFRRLFQDMGNSVFVDPFSYAKINAYALESVDGELFRLPKELRLNTFASLQKFEAYLDAVAKRSEEEKAKLSVPTTFLTAAQVGVNYPELVQKRYFLEIASANKKALESNVSVKDSWNWEVSDAGWDQLKKQFPELGVKKAASRDERFAALDSLDPKTRARVDGVARASIVDAHPEWLDKALSEATPMKLPVGLHEKGGNALFTGMTDGKELMALLDAAPFASEDAATAKPAAKSAAEKLRSYTADKTVYYRINVVERSGQPEVLTFAEADQEGVLGKIVDKQLEAYYAKIRDEDPKVFQKEDKSWKPFADVKDTVAERYYDKLLKNIRSIYAAGIAPEKAPEEMIPDYAATLRLYSYIQEAKAKLQKDPALMASMTQEPSPAAKDSGNALPKATPLEDQWKLERSSHQSSRSSGNSVLDSDHAFKLAVGEWTKVNTPGNGDLNFFHVTKKGNGATENAIVATVNQVRDLLSDDAQQRLMYLLLADIKAKGAISLDYMNNVAESEFSQTTSNDEG